MAVYSFADVTVDEAGFRARRGAEQLVLEPKALEVLLVLLARPGQLVTKAELQAAVWRDTAVTESALTRVVAQLRKALDDDARDARFIETVPTRGYRFIALVRTHTAAPEAPSPETPGRQARPYARVRPGLMAAAALVVAAALAAGWRLSRGGTSRERTARPSPMLLSSTPGINGFPGFSPDGGSVVFASDRTGTFELYVRAVQPSAREVAITADGQQNVQPAWSPDGRSIAYVSLRRGGIWLVPASGGAPRQISTFGGRPAWSPDGATVAFQSQTPTHPLAYSGASGSVLWTVASIGGEPRLLTRRSGVGHGSPAFSPDGGRIAYAAGRSLWTIRPDGTDARRLHEFQHDLDNVFFARDGRSIYVALAPAAPVDPRGRLWRLPSSPGGDRAGEPEEVEGDRTRGQMTLAPDGRRIAYVEAEWHHGIDFVALAPDGSAMGPPQPLLPQLTLRAMAPVFSPDGARLAMGVFRPGGGWSLWVAAADGTRAEPVRADPSTGSHQSWLRDGRIVASERVPGKDAYRLVAFDPANGRSQVLLDLGFIMAAARVSPDGSRAAYMRAPSDDEVLQVWTVGLPGGAPRQVTHDPEGVGWPIWSPDGRTLAVEALRRGNSVLGLIPAEGGPLRLLSERPEHNWTGDFTSDGRNVTFAAQRGGVWNVCLVATEGGPERCVTSYDRFDGYLRSPAIAPGGDRVVFERARITARLWLGELP